jgi:uroporphyrin-III C-methyltransferase
LKAYLLLNWRKPANRFVQAMTDTSDSTQLDSPPTRATPWWRSPALYLALLALALSGWQWREQHLQAKTLRLEIAKRLTTDEETAKQFRSNFDKAQELADQTQSRLSQVEGKLAESQSQQIALETLYQQLSRNPDEISLAEVEQTIGIANQQLQLAGNPKAALIALEAADARLARSDKPQWIALRKSINADMEKLKALPLVDTVGMSIQLNNMILETDTLPFVVTDPPPEKPVVKPSDLGFFARAWDDMKQLIKVRNLDVADPALFAPTQNYFLRENLKLHLLSARLALLARDDGSFRNDIKAAQDILGKYFDTQATPVVAALNTLKHLSDSHLDIALPEIGSSVDAVRRVRQARDKGPSK